ncbi:MAG: pyridoxal-dependent decarboxylase [Gemmatimonadota bacterium]|nr:pyridoxal-dependent decarboxylase [Gemmatimonadota bacterium]
MNEKAGMTPEQFRHQAHAVVDWIADYLANPERWSVLPDTRPGDIAKQLPASPPQSGERMDAILADFRDIIVAGTTHWNHPAFLAYFANSGTAEGVIGEMLTAALNVNAMLWKSGPAQTELETRTLDWLRQMMGLADGFTGTITDTASSSTLYALAAAREMAPQFSLREKGMSGRPDLPRLLVYASEEAHSSIDKAVMTLGFGRESLRRVPTDDDLGMDAAALDRMIRDDRMAGAIPLAVVACVGTTSTTAIDPVALIAGICAREKIWLHVDAAYGGSAAILPEMRYVLDGCDGADSLVVNPHKWLLTPMDCSVLFTRKPELLKRAFQVVPDYLKVSEPDSVVNLMDYGVSLGRRFRSLKLWMVIRSYGVQGLASVIREHIRLAAELAEKVESDPEFELFAKPRFSTVVFRYRGHGPPEVLNERNRRIVENVNATRRTFISHTTVRGSYAIRVAIGNLHTNESHVTAAWDLIRKAASES